MGRALRVGWADDYNRVGGEVKARDPKKNRETAQLHVSFVCEDSCRMVSEMELGLVFGVFGNVVDIAIKKNVLNKVSGVQSGYAFVHFALTLGGLESALSAAERVNERMIDGIRYKCKTDQALLMQYMSLKSCNGLERCNGKTFKANIASTPLRVSSPVLLPAPIAHESRNHSIHSPRKPVSHVDRDIIRRDQTYKPVISPLHFSTYGSGEEAHRVYFSPLSDGRFILVRRNQQFLRNEPSLATRSFLSANENDFPQPSETMTSSSFSFCYNESPSYSRCTFNPIPEGESSRNGGY